MSGKWPLVRISDICADVNVGFVGPSTAHRDDEGIPFLMGKNIGPGFLKLRSLDRVTESFHEKNIKSQLNPGDVVVVRIGNSGQAAVVPDDFGPANCSGLVIIKKPSEILAEYLVYYLNSPIGRAYSMSQAIGSTRSTLNTKTVAETLIPLPPLEEQKRIVAKLDEALGYVDELDVTSQLALNEIDALWNRYLAESFIPSASTSKETPAASGWSLTNLGALLTLEYGKGLDSSVRKSDGEYPVYGAAGVKSYSDDYLVEGESIVIGRKGSAGQLTRVNGKFWPLDVAYYVQLKTNKVDIDYLFNWLDLRDLTKMAKGVKPGINRNEVYELVIAIPTLDEQKSIVAKLDAIKSELDGLKGIKMATQAESAAMRSAILSAAFAGDF